MGRGLRTGKLGGRRARAALVFILLVGALFATEVEAQTRFMYLRGQAVSPAYEGWWPNQDGSYTLFYGYMNTNWEEEFDIPVGRENYFTFTEPGGLDDTERTAYDPNVADQGQPTHFYPRRNPFLFTIEVPSDFGDAELVWTLQTQGTTLRAFGSLKPDYRIDPHVISTEIGGAFGSLSDALRTNIPPELSVEGELRRTVRVGEPLELAVVANDPDNIPARSGRGANPPATSEALYNPPSSVVSMSGPGLRFSWSVYRGRATNVTFDPIQMKTWTDTRVYSNSPWSPPWGIPEPPAGSRWTATATFTEPGEYVLRGIASDGALFTYENVTVTVTR
ncbi:MAG: hypothetical protein WEG36_05100 [Gemmatimonadota bacterium]